MSTHMRSFGPRNARFCTGDNVFLINNTSYEHPKNCYTASETVGILHFFLPIIGKIFKKQYQ